MMLLNNRNRDISAEELATFSRDFIDDLASDKLAEFCRISLRVIIDSWQDVMIIPHRMLDTTRDVTRNRVSRIPTRFRDVIIMKCKNYLDNFHLTFPFIAVEDLDFASNEDFFMHVPDLRGQQ